MPLEVTIDEAQRLVRIRGWGEIADSDLSAARERFRTDPDLDPRFPRLCDLTEVTAGSVSTQALEDWAGDPFSNPAVRHAVVCSSAVAVQMATNFATSSRQYFREVSLFPSEAQAKVWMAEGPNGETETNVRPN